MTQRPASRVALITLSAAQLMFLLDATIVNIALPSIQESLRMTGPSLEWVVTAYSLPFGGLLLLGGRSGDILGRRRVFTAGLTLFTTASLLGGLAVASWWLLACRALQGIGAAAAYPATLALITATFPEGRDRHRAMGTNAAVSGAGGSIGLLAGGFITTYLSWRWVMFINVPIGVVIIMIARRVLPETSRRPDEFDLAGALTVTAGLALAVYALITGATDEHGRAHWTDPSVLASLTTAAVLLTVFVLIERHSAHPLVPLRIFADASRSASYAIAIMLGSAMVGIYFFMTLFLQRVWDYSPLRTGVLYIPLSVTLIGMSYVGARLVGRIGQRALVLGGLIVAAGGMAWLSRLGHTGGYLTGLLAPALVTYSGIGLALVSITLAAVAGVPVADSGLASGLYSSARQVGGATGLAVLGTITWALVASASLHAAPGSRHIAGLPFTASALVSGINHSFLVAAGVTAASALVAAVLIRPETRAAPEPAGTERQTSDQRLAS